MPLALRPLVTSGVAIVGASVLVAAPITPTPPDVRVPNPSVERDVALTAAAPASRPIEDSINAVLFRLAGLDVSIAQLATPLIAPLIEDALGVPPEQAEVVAKTLLATFALGLAGPLISGPGAIGYALQEVVDSEGLEELVLNLIGGLGNVVDGFVNGGYGPDLTSLLTPDLMAALAALPQTVAGGLIGQGGLYRGASNLPGTIPTVQGIIDLVSLLLNAPEAEAFNAALVNDEESRPIEDGVNKVLYAATAVTLRLVTLAAPLVAPILDVDEEEAAQFLAIGTLGFIGPLISGTGGVGHALQDLVDSEDFADFLDNSLDLIRLPVSGAVNGGQGPNLQPLLDLPPAIPLVTGGCTLGPGPGCAVVTDVYAPGLIQSPDFGYDPALEGLGLQLDGVGSPTPTATLITPGTIPTLQGLAGRVFDALPGGDTESVNNLTVAGGQSLAGDDETKVEPKKRNRPLLNLVRNSPLADMKPAGARHLPGIGKHPVRDLIKKVVNGGQDKDDDGGDTNTE